VHTIAITKSNHSKILRGNLPMKWQNFGNTTFTGGQSFVFFYDEDELRIVHKRNEHPLYHKVIIYVDSIAHIILSE